MHKFFAWTLLASETFAVIRRQSIRRPPAIWNMSPLNVHFTRFDACEFWNLTAITCGQKLRKSPVRLHVFHGI